MNYEIKHNKETKKAVVIKIGSELKDFGYISGIDFDLFNLKYEQMYIKFNINYNSRFNKNFILNITLPNRIKLKNEYKTLGDLMVYIEEFKEIDF